VAASEGGVACKFQRLVRVAGSLTWLMWHAAKGSGQARALDRSWAKELPSWRQGIGLEEGIIGSVEWNRGAGLGGNHRPRNMV
jgi:hypothetical protein